MDTDSKYHISLVLAWLMFFCCIILFGIIGIQDRKFADSFEMGVESARNEVRAALKSKEASIYVLGEFFVYGPYNDKRMGSKHRAIKGE